MNDTQLVMYDEDYRKILAVIQKLVRDANAKGIFVVDRNGQLIGEAGEMRGIDTTSLASLTAGCIAATGGLAKIVGEEEFPIHFHQGQRDNLHITLVAKRIILVVVFDEGGPALQTAMRADSPKLGLVQLDPGPRRQDQRQGQADAGDQHEVDRAEAEDGRLVARRDGDGLQNEADQQTARAHQNQQIDQGQNRHRTPPRTPS